MKWTFSCVGILIFGFFGIMIISLFNEITVSNEQDYYTLKDAVEASMIEAVDITYYRLTGSIKINQEKFVENFTRRFSQVATYGAGNYDIEFYDISETPPKVSVRIVDSTKAYNIFGTFGADPTKVNVVNQVSAIMDVYDPIIPGEDIIYLTDPMDFVGIDDPIFRYKDKYYTYNGEETSFEECTLIDNGLKCITENEEEVILQELSIDNNSGQDIPDDDVPNPTPTPFPGEEENDDKESIEVNMVNISSYSVGTDILNPKYKFYLVDIATNKVYIPDNVDRVNKPKNVSNSCYLRGEKIYCLGVNNIEYSYTETLGIKNKNSPLRCFKTSDSGYYLVNLAFKENNSSCILSNTCNTNCNGNKNCNVNVINKYNIGWTLDSSSQTYKFSGYYYYEVNDGVYQEIANACPNNHGNLSVVGLSSFDRLSIFCGSEPNISLYNVGEKNSVCN